jgi:hypothetical protein
VWREIIYTANNIQREGRRYGFAACRRRRLSQGLLRGRRCAFPAAKRPLDSFRRAGAALRLRIGAGSVSGLKALPR